MTLTKQSLEGILQELMPKYQVSSFSLGWILGNPKATEDSIRESYLFLRSKGLSDKKIASEVRLLGMDRETLERKYKRLSALGLKDGKIATYVQLLGRDPEIIERNYGALRRLGLSDRKIATHPYLLGIKPETIERNYQRLKELGLSDRRIASQAHLLGRDPKSIEKNYQRLKALRLDDGRIASQAQLLAMKPETVERNYRHHAGLLRKDYKDRNSGRHLLLTQAQLLGIPPDTIEANVQYLHSIGVDYNDSTLLATKPSTRRQKMAWMLRELFDYRSLPADKRRETANGLYDFIRDNPRVLSDPMSSLERKKDKLKERARLYIK